MVYPLYCGWEVEIFGRNLVSAGKVKLVAKGPVEAVYQARKSFGMTIDEMYGASPQRVTDKFPTEYEATIALNAFKKLELG